MAESYAGQLPFKRQGRRGNREGTARRHPPLARGRRGRGGCHRRRHAPLSAPARRLLVRRRPRRRPLRLGLGRLCRVRDRAGGRGGLRDRQAQAPHVRDLRRRGLERRPALRRRDRRLRGEGRVSDLLERLAAIQERGARAVLFTVVEGDGAGDKLLVEEGETGSDLAAEADEVIRGARNALLELPGRKVFAEVYMPPPRLFVYGAVDIAEALCKAAKLLGWSTYVADARRAFATKERFPSADHLIVKWAEEAIAEGAPAHQIAAVVLTPDARFDQPALQGILATEAFYVGALGS